jgi:hypothetical protein
MHVWTSLTKCGSAGGAQLSWESCEAAVVGLIAGSPLAALKAGVWSDAARRAFPPLQEMQQKEADALRPLLQSMSPAQVLLSAQLSCRLCKLALTAMKHAGADTLQRGVDPCPGVHRLQGLVPVLAAVIHTAVRHCVEALILALGVHRSRW